MKIRLFRRAFTLVELLVVMAIIMVLLGIALPALFAARNQSYAADCTSNLNNLGKGLTQFCTTLNQNLPAPDGFTAAQIFSASGSNLVQTLADFGVETNSAVWFCKRHLKYGNLDRTKEALAGRIGYYYWGWSSPSGTTAAIRIDLMSTNSAWQEFGYSTNAKAAVLASCPFRDGKLGRGPSAAGTNDIQFHAGSRYEISLSEPGSMILMVGGAVQKIGPMQR